MTMRQRIAETKLFTDYVEGLPEDRTKAKLRMMAFNASRPDQIEERFQIVAEIFGRTTKAWIEPPFYFCYGTNIELGDGCYLNFNCNFVDDGKIVIGKKVMFGPGVTIATVGHPIRPDLRSYMYAAQVTIESNCWIGAGAIIGPGITIGENSVIGAGSVVTHDIPSNSVAVGNPCRVLRSIGEQDQRFYFRDYPIDLKDLEEEGRLRRG